MTTYSKVSPMFWPGLSEIMSNFENSPCRLIANLLIFLARKDASHTRRLVNVSQDAFRH